MADRLCFRKIGSPNRDGSSRLLEIAFDRAMALESEVSEDVLNLPGMSGRLYRMFINNLVRITSKPRYLEIGSWAGSTACSAMYNNSLSVVCVDNWSQFGGPKTEFLRNIDLFSSPTVDFRFYEKDFRELDFSEMGMFNIYLFDGPHEETDQYDALSRLKPSLDNELIFIVDDWNWKKVREGTLNAIRDTGYGIDYAIEIRTTLNDQHADFSGPKSDWHNGYFLSKLSRERRF